MDDDGLDAARALLPGLHLQAAAELGSGRRSSVQRVVASDDTGAHWPLVVKQYHSMGEGWARESAALTIIDERVRVPRLIACGASPPVIVTRDLGDGASVADALLGNDRDIAARALIDWAETIADLHVATRSGHDDFTAALEPRLGDIPVAASPIAVALDEAVRVLDRELATLGVRVPAGALEQLRDLGKRLGPSGPAALTPADACPDNNVLTPAGLALLDFEGAQWRHVAWDVAYLSVPWPSCWCSWRVPDDVAAAAVRAYRTRAAAAFPEVAEPEFDSDLEAATVGWALISTSWFIDNALGDDPVLNADRPTPTRRAMITHRLAAAAATTELAESAALADALRQALHQRWGDVPLAFAPAFADGALLRTARDRSAAESISRVLSEKRTVPTSAETAPNVHPTTDIGGARTAIVQRWHGLESIPSGWGRCVATIGVFDGIHRGHQAIIGEAVRMAGERGVPSVLITFVPHPSEVVRPGSHPPVLTTIVRRAELAEQLGVDVFCPLPFTLEFSKMAPDAFVHSALVERLHALGVVVGENFRFGHKAAGDVAMLERLGRTFGFSAHGVPLLKDGDTPLSATYVRSCVQAGDMRTAAEVLGRPHRVDGVVERGDRRGRELGFPTANLRTEAWTAVPADGVYAGRVVRLDEWGRTMPDDQLGIAAISVGTNPTFEVRQRRVEAYILDFERDLYGDALGVEFIERLRGMEKFDSVDALVTQMHDDVQRTRQLLG